MSTLSLVVMGCWMWSTMKISMYLNQGIVKGEVFCFRYYVFFLQPAKCHGESTSTAHQLSHKINKVPLLLQNLDINILLTLRSDSMEINVKFGILAFCQFNILRF